MIIGLNLLPFQKTLTGTAVYALNISKQLLKINKNHRFIFFINRETKAIFSEKNFNARTVILPFSPKTRIIRIFWEQFILPFYLKKYKVDLLFSPSVVSPIFLHCKNVICIHDLIPFQVRKKYSIFRSFYVKLMTRISAKRADYIFSVSQNSKRDIHEILSIKNDKIGVTYNAVNESIFLSNPNEWDNYRKNAGVRDKYILFVGTIEPGKNIVTLIKAFDLLVKKYNIQHDLVIAGKQGWLFNNIFFEVKRRGLANRVIFTGYVPDNVLGSLYKEADVFVLPSLYEGFGVPALEAMALGTPVVVSNVSSFPEIVGNAGLLVNPLNKSEIAEAIKRVIFDDNLRKNLIKKGLKQAKNFSWEKSAKVILKIFEEI